MRYLSRILLAVVVLAASGLLAFWVTVALRSRGPQQPLPDSAQSRSEAVVRTSEMRHTQDGKLAWRVLLDELQVDRGGQTVKVEGLQEGLVYDRTGAPALRITADKVHGDTAQKNFTVFGKVVVTSPKGFIIRTEQAAWANAQKKVQCPGQVTMKARNIVIATTGLEYALEAETVTCPNRVRMYSGDNTVTGRNLVYDVAHEKTYMQDITMVIDPEEGRRILKEWKSE